MMTIGGGIMTITVGGIGIQRVILGLCGMMVVIGMTTRTDT
jgi:hypothetical protein